MKKARKRKIFVPIAAWNTPLAPKPWPRTPCGLSGAGTLDHDQIIVLPVETGCGKVRGAGAQHAPISIEAAIETSRVRDESFL